MRKALIVCGVAASLMAPVGAAATKPADKGKAANPNAAKPNAAQQCRAERAELGVDAFREEYGTNKNKRNAFGKCVSRKRHES
jgi:hypothetical protein